MEPAPMFERGMYESRPAGVIYDKLIRLFGLEIVYFRFVSR